MAPFQQLILFISFSTITIACSAVDTKAPKTTLPQIDSIIADTVLELGTNIMGVFQDKKNNYWFCSWEEGLYKYDGETILHYSTENGFPNNRIDEIKEDHLGNVYFNTSSGILKFNGNNFQYLLVSELENDWKLEKNDLWFKDGWDSEAVFRYDGTFLYRLKLPSTKIGEEYMKKNPSHANPYTVYCIYQDSQKNMWFGTAALGAFRYNGKSFDWILEKDVVEIFNAPTEGANGIRSITEDGEGKFWFNSAYVYTINDHSTAESESFYLREKNIGSLDGKKDGNLIEYLSSVKDKQNNLWFATYQTGIWKYDGKKITHFPVQFQDKDITVFSIYNDNNDNLWLGTHENGILRFNGTSFEKFIFKK